MGSRVGIIFALACTAALVALGVMSFHEGTAKSRPVVVPFDLFWCEQDDDCVVTKTIGCCSCRQGGGQAAVTKWHTDDLRRFLKTACHKGQQVCVQVNVCRDDLKARCVDKQCRLRHGDG